MILGFFFLMCEVFEVPGGWSGFFMGWLCSLLVEVMMFCWFDDFFLGFYVSYVYEKRCFFN